MATFSPEFVREQSRQNLSDMSRLVDSLYQRADTPEAREALATMSKAVSSLKPVGSVPQVLDVESQIKKVLSDYNANLDADRAEGIDKATVSIIRELVATRKKMCNCTVDADLKRGFKSYAKANKGTGTKKELKAAYTVRYQEAMAEVDGYVREAKTLDQLVKSYRLRTREMGKQRELDELNKTVQTLAARYKKSTDQAERDRLNAEYQTLLRKKNALDAALMGYKDAMRNVETVESLLSQLSAQAETAEIDSISAEDFTALAQSVTAGIKKARGRNAAIDEAYGAVESANQTMLRRAGERMQAGETLDSVILAEQNAGLDAIEGVASAAEAPALAAPVDNLDGEI